MDKAMAFGQAYWNDLEGAAAANGLGLRHRGIMFKLLWAQHMAGGSIPADMTALRRLVGDDVKSDEITAVLKIFFVPTADGRLANPQHAESLAKAREVYDAKVAGGISGAIKRWGLRSSPNGTPNNSPNGTPYSNQNQEPEPNQNQISTGASRGKKNGQGPGLRGGGEEESYEDAERLAIQSEGAGGDDDDAPF
jgi:uncharacterized protein YdaU (DUF1376 family)